MARREAGAAARRDPGVIRIAHLITGLQTGGAEKMLARLVSGMDRDRFHNTVISMTGADVVGTELQARGIPTRSLHMPRGIADPLGLMRLVELLRNDPHTILQTWLYHADLMGVIAGRLTSVPRIVWNIRCSDMNMHNYRWMSRRLPGMLARLSETPDLVVVNSQSGQRVHEQYGYHPRSWRLIPNGFDMDRLKPDPAARASLRQELGVSDDTVLIGLPARLDPMKDHMTFLAAATDLAARIENVRFLLVGRGLDHANLMMARCVRACGLGDRVSLLGERRDMERVLAGLDIATLSSAFGEGFPNVLGEAMACGVPCVSTDVGDASSIIGDTGLTVSSRDPTALSTAWRRLIELGPERRRELGEAARRRIAENYSLPVVIRQYEDLYSELAGR